MEGKSTHRSELRAVSNAPYCDVQEFHVPSGIEQNSHLRAAQGYIRDVLGISDIVDSDGRIRATLEGTCRMAASSHLEWEFQGIRGM